MAFMLQTIALTAQNMVAEKHLTIALTGDIMMGTTYPNEQLPVQRGANCSFMPSGC